MFRAVRIVLRAQKGDVGATAGGFHVKLDLEKVGAVHIFNAKERSECSSPVSHSKDLAPYVG